MKNIGIVSMLNDFTVSPYVLKCFNTLKIATDLHFWNEPSLFETIRDSPIERWFFTGSPALVTEPNSPSLDSRILGLKSKSFLFVCYSHQWLCRELGAPIHTFEPTEKTEPIYFTTSDPLLESFEEHPAVWLCYRQAVLVSDLPAGWKLLARRGEQIMGMRRGNHYSLQFHPEREELSYPMVESWFNLNH